MRLTLRTLLSWKDGMLEIEAARELAAKVQASEAARRLVDRIDEVAGRATLSAPPPDATGFADDANSTAAYLDNVLSDRELGEFERACFASDEHLAETAACHDILAAWSRQPAEPLDPAARRRLLAVVQARATDVDRRGSVPAGPAATPAGQRAGAGSRPAGYGRPSAAAWALVTAAALLLVALCGILGWSLARRPARAGASRAVAARAAAEPAAPGAEAGPDVAARVPDAEPAASSPPVDVPAKEPATPVADAGPTEEPAGAEDSGAPAAEAPPAAAPVAATEPPAEPTRAGANVERRVPHGDALAIAAPASPAPAPPPAPAAAAAPVAPAAAAVAGSAVLLHRPAGGATDAWMTAADGTPLDLPVDLVAPACGRPSLVVDGIRIAFEPCSRAVLGRDADGTPRLELVFGGAVAAGEGRLGVTVGGLAGVVGAGLAAPVGVEVSLERRPGAAAEAAGRVARVVPAGPRIEWRPTAADGGPLAAPLGRAATVPAGQAIVWRSDAPQAAAVAPAGPLPAWLAGRSAEDPVDRRAAQALAGRLAAGSPALPPLRELAGDRRVENRLAAAATLALLGDFTAVARLLSADGAEKLPESMWTRLDAVAVRPALARGPRAADALAGAFVAQGPPGAADTIMRFARGLSDEAIAAGAAVDLVDALESPHLVVRRYAIANLVEITGVDGVDRLRYRADRPPEALREGAAWWRARLDQGRIRRAGAGG